MRKGHSADRRESPGPAVRRIAAGKITGAKRVQDGSGAGKGSARLLVLALTLFAWNMSTLLTSGSALAQSSAGSEISSQLGRTSGSTRYGILRDLKYAGRISKDLTASDLNTIIEGMEAQRAQVVRLMRSHLVPNLTAADVVALSGRATGSTRYGILRDLKLAGRLSGNLSISDLNSIIAGMEDYRAAVVRLMRSHLVPNLKAADVVALCGPSTGSVRYGILRDLKTAGRISKDLSVADLNTIIAGMEEYRADVVRLMRHHLAKGLAAEDVVGVTAATAPIAAIGGTSGADGPVVSVEQRPTGAGAGEVPTGVPVGILVDRLIQSVPDNPPYLYETDTFSGAVATVAADLLGSPEKRKLYDEYYFAAMEYRTMALVQFALARRAARGGADATAREHISHAMRLLDRQNAYASAANEVFLGNIDKTYARVKPVYDLAKLSAKLLAQTPAAALAVDVLFTGMDYYVNRSSAGVDAANAALIQDVAVMVVLRMPTQVLEGKSVSDVLRADTTKVIGSSRLYSILDEQLGNPEFQKQFMSALAETGAAGADLVADEAFSDLLRSPSSGSVRNVLPGQ